MIEKYNHWLLVNMTQTIKCEISHETPNQHKEPFKMKEKFKQVMHKPYFITFLYL